MHGHLLRLINKTYAFDLTYRPNFFKLSDPLQKEKFQTLLNCEGLLVYDKIIDQVKELIKTRHPEKKLTIDEISLLAEKEFKGQTHDEFGVWVFYPWTNKLIHILDQPQFIELRTNRNLYKITIEERNRLSTKIVGVVGLSVGQSVALTMATERTFGEIRIADHDNLDLSNLNRIRSGLHNIGLSKVIITAREISEIDPFLKVTCFHEGIHSNNIDSFFLEGGKLDVLIEECDSVDIKILAREKAKKYGIPVIMEASDRGTVDIERFDLEKDRPIFHGNVINVSSEYLRGLSNEEKIPYILPIAGIDTLSPRMKASMMEVGKTIYTWPQLASAVVLGGAIAADIYRRIVLNQLQISGRFFIDLEELICDAPNDNFPFLNNILKKSTINNNFAKHSSLTIIESCIDINIIKKMVEKAHLAPSIGNSQPWLWQYANGILFLLLDLKRSDSFGNVKNMGSYISLGCAIENLKLTAEHFKLELEISYFPFEDSNIVASIQFKKSLYDFFNSNYTQINFRSTNRRIVERKSIDEQLLNRLRLSVQNCDGINLLLVTDIEKIKQIATISGESERLRLTNPQGHHDFFSKEIRWNKIENDLVKDGIDIETLELSPLQIAGLKVAKDPRSMALIRSFKMGSALNEISEKAINAASAIGIFYINEKSSKNYVLAGQYIEKIWLEASACNISVQPILAPIFLFSKSEYNELDEFDTHEISIIKNLHKNFKSVTGDTDNHAVFIFRFFIDSESPKKSLRRPLEEILNFGE